MNEQPPVKIPRVAGVSRRARVAPYVIGFGFLGTAVFASLASNRAEREEQASALPPLQTTTVAAPAPPPAAATVETKPQVTIPFTSAPPPSSTISPIARERPVYVGSLPVAPAAPPESGVAERARNRASAPALVIDLGPTKTSAAGADSENLQSPEQRSELQASAQFGSALQAAAVHPSLMSLLRTGLPGAAFFRSASAQSDPVGASIATAGPPADPPVAVAPVVVGTGENASARDLNPNERFSTRAGNRETEVARAQRLPNQDMLVTQGTIIGAVMETALNSDLPGFARAIVSRDVLSFDGSQVLIPAGSRVIGEYNSAVAQGASRIFIIWNRLIRPDGVTVSLASPAVDELGRGGLGGSVNRHLLQRYGGAILLSVLTGGLNALAQSRRNGSTVVINSTNEATTLAGQASRGSDIPPTIKTRQGALVQIFVARDLDFSPVGPAL
jgi:type IV secretion system protein VirB10